MAILANIILFVVGISVLLASGSLFVRSLTKISSFLKISEFVFSFIVVGFATSIPELFVGINAALQGTPSISLGNVIGSNIANLTIILGIPILLAKGLPIKSPTLKKDSLYMFFIALVPLVLMMFGNQLSRIDGVILISVFVIYSIWLIKQRKGFTKHIHDNVKKLDVIISSFLFIISGIILHYSSKMTVHYASALSVDLLLPPIFIGLFVIALGTSLPELVVGLKAASRKQEDIILGNIMGSVVVNSTIVLGVTSIIMPITANITIFLTSIGFMILAAFLFTSFVESGNKIYWKEGVAMIIIYVLFVMIEMYIQGLPGLS